MPIDLIRVEGLTSVLGLSEGILKSYQEFLDAFKWLKERKGKETIPKLIKKQGYEGLITSFSSVVSDYLQSIGLEIDRWSTLPHGLRILLRPNSMIWIGCEGIKIVPGRENILDGFKPELGFFIDLGNSDEIKVTSQLEEEGCDLLSLITPTLLCFYLPNQNNSPVIKRLEGRRIAMASIVQIRPFLRNMETIAQFLDKKKIKQLEEAKMNMIKAPPEFERAAKGIYTLTLLETLGLEI